MERIGKVNLFQGPNVLKGQRQYKVGIGKNKKEKGKPDWRDLPGKSIVDYVYNDANQLLEEQITRGRATRINKYFYDANGNQVQVIRNFGHPQQEEFNWGYDFENQQVSFDAPGTKKDSTYIYNAEGKRIAKNVSGTIEKYILDGANVLADYDGTNDLQASYLTPFLDQNLLVTRNSSDYFYMQDGLGSVRDLVDSSEAVQNSYDYYAFGKILSESENIPNRYKFTSREWDPESKTYDYRARDNDPFIGRFLQPNPVGYWEGINLYTYVLNSPTSNIDPLGLTDIWAWEIDLIVRLKMGNFEWKFYKKWRDPKAPNPPFGKLKTKVEASEPYKKAKQKLDKKLKEKCKPGEKGTNKIGLIYDKCPLAFVLRKADLCQNWKCVCTKKIRDRLYTSDTYDFKDVTELLLLPFRAMEALGLGHPYPIKLDHPIK